MTVIWLKCSDLVFIFFKFFEVFYSIEAIPLNFRNLLKYQHYTPPPPCPSFLPLPSPFSPCPPLTLAHGKDPFVRNFSFSWIRIWFRKIRSLYHRRREVRKLITSTSTFKSQQFSEICLMSVKRWGIRSLSNVWYLLSIKWWAWVWKIENWI